MGDDENACVRNIVKEIIREMNPKKITVNKNFVTYLTKLLLINPNWGIGDDFFSQRQNVQHFVKYVIDDLLKVQDDPKIVTLKIQFYFSCNLERMDYAIEVNRRDLRNKLLVLKEDIFTFSKVEDRNDVDALYKKIVYYITLASGLGNPAKPKVFEETLVALKSILYESELNEFVTLSKQEKQIQLCQMTKVVAGIRLFDKDCDKGGEGIANLPELLDKAIHVIRGGTEETLLMIMERVNTLTTAVEKCYHLKQTYHGYQMICIIPDELSVKIADDIEYIKHLLIFFRQYELLIRKILDELEQINEKTELIFTNMEKMLKLIHETVYMKIAIPVGVVFPLFEQLWEIWEEFQNQGLLLSRLSMIMSNMETYAKHTRYDHLVIEHLLGTSSSLTDAERLEKTAQYKLVSDNPEIRVVRSEAIKNFYNLKLEYLGFCCWKLIETDGALIPGNPSMGIVIYKLKNYVFSCIEAFEEFCKDPEILVQSKVELKMCEDKSLQTVHQATESFVDSTYKWNIWDLKREALTQANLLSAVTVSTQTIKTSSKNSVRAQTYNKKIVDTQTSKDRYTTMPKNSVFIYGLRGKKDDKQFKIDLTRPIDES
ncbi:cilia- and flagella-associated protein 206 isoform X2 [Dendroctonus ponderosae]|uniref:cilia- and flagella-associated protein 206 isoform X2 n=1 Tax=Dendroctonus ponderosae TaxID=77166 RepID=UPI0020363A71|nr:cilia- and flagella-associated protein 206 isoform X2 [Dendroctonus ponderosae]